MMPQARDILTVDLPVERWDPDAESLFFRCLRMSNGTYKTTANGRMTELDARLAAHLAERVQPAQVLDVGVSSGVTTANLSSRLRESGVVADILAVDLFASGVLVESGPLAVLLDEQRYVLQVAVGGMARGRPHNPRQSILHRALDWAMQATGQLALSMPSGRRRDVKLASALLRRDPSITMASHDVFVRQAPWQDKFDAVRVANLLNHSYFSEELLRKGVANICSYVAPGGLLVLNRTDDDGTNHGAIFQRVEKGWQELDRFGGGSEVAALLESPFI